MEYKAKVSFSGKVTMYKGQILDLDPKSVQEYVKCGYLVSVKKPKDVKTNENKRNSKK